MSQTITPTSGNPLPPRTSALSIWSLVLGILSVIACFFSILFAIPAVICGHLALSRIKRSGGALQGQGLAIGGLVTGYIGILIFPLLMVIAYPNFVRARAMAQETVCINNLRIIDSAKQQWALEHKKTATDTPTWEDLRPYLGHGPAGDLPQCPAGGEYKINAVGVKPTCSVAEHVLP